MLFVLFTVQPEIFLIVLITNLRKSEKTPMER